jgi:ribonucleoside-diphosphate reductase alpha chain
MPVTCFKKIDLSQNVRTILERRYLQKNAEGDLIETPEEMFSRVARAIAEVDKLYDKTANTEELAREFCTLMTDFRFLPNSPTLMNAGTDLGQLSACFVLPVGDSMQDIFETVKNTAMIHKTGGGTGFSFSTLRPKSDFVRSTGGVASGPISFMKVFNSATEAVKQGGRRRGANMGILRVDHPDIVDFIEAKGKEGELSNFNLSVGITDEFMRAYEAGEEYDLVNPRSKKVVGTLSAKDVFDKLVEGAWKNGEPGVIFIDTINRKNPLPGIGDIEATNPCGEQPLLPYESCNLGSINLAKFVSGQPFYLEADRVAGLTEAKKKIDWDGLQKTVRTSVHFLDNVIDANRFPLRQIEEMTKSTRKVGLGVMGYADMLFQLGVPHSSDTALRLARHVMKFINETAREVSVELGEARGSFSYIEKSIYEEPMRNSTVTTIAPTGTISMIAETSSGIEPAFSLAYVKKVLDGSELLYVNKYFEEAANELGFHSDGLMQKIASARSIKGFKEIPKHIRRIFETTFDISFEHHLKVQAAFQAHTDNAVSKTINLPNSAKVEDVDRAYLLAYRHGCKGVTVYRDGSRVEQVISVAQKVDEKDDSRRAPGTLAPRARPSITTGKTIKLVTEMGSLYITINQDGFGPFEIFVHLGKSGSSLMALIEAIGRLTSLSLRSGVSPKVIIKQLKGIKSTNPVRQEDGGVVFSVPDAIAKALEKYIAGGEQKSLFNGKNPQVVLSPMTAATEESKSKVDVIEEITSDVCPECGGVMVYIEACFTCRDCGYSLCA